MLGRNDVMVVYGRNEAARLAMFTYLRALALEPIEWESAVAAAGGGSPYTGSVVRNAISNAGAVIVLLTGDDVAKIRPVYVTGSDGSSERELTGQARPNVIMEFGMALMASEEKTIVVELEPTRGISDAFGRNNIRFHKDDRAFRNSIANRLEIAGCDVKRVGNDWLTVGDFAGAIAYDHLITDKSSATSLVRRAPLARRMLKDAFQLAINRMECNDRTLGRLRLLSIREVDADGRVYVSGGRSEYDLVTAFPALQKELRNILEVPVELHFVKDILR